MKASALWKRSPGSFSSARITDGVERRGDARG